MPITPLVRMPFKTKKRRECAGFIVCRYGLLDVRPAIHDDLEWDGCFPVCVLAMGRKGIEVQIRSRNLVAPFEPALGAAEFVMIVDVAPIQMILCHS